MLGADNRLRVWDSRTLHLLSVSPPLKFASFGVLLGVDPATGSVLLPVDATAYGSPGSPPASSLALYDPMRPTAPLQRFTVTGIATGASFSPDGRQLALAINVPNSGGTLVDGFLDVVDLSSKHARPRRVHLDPLGATHVQWSADGSRILYSGNTQLLAVNPKTLSVIAHQALPQSNHCCVGTFTTGSFVNSGPPLSDVYASLNPDGLLSFLTEGARSAELPVIGTPGSSANDITMSPDGHLLAGAWSIVNSGGVLQLWSLPSGRLLASTTAYGGTVSFLDNDRLLVLDGNDALVLSLDPKTLVTMACADAGRNLSKQEFSDFLGSEPYHRTCPQWPAG